MYSRLHETLNTPKLYTKLRVWSGIRVYVHSLWKTDLAFIKFFKVFRTLRKMAGLVDQEKWLSFCSCVPKPWVWCQVIQEAFHVASIHEQTVASNRFRPAKCYPTWHPWALGLGFIKSIVMSHTTCRMWTLKIWGQRNLTVLLFPLQAYRTLKNADRTVYAPCTTTQYLGVHLTANLMTWDIEFQREK